MIRTDMHESMGSQESKIIEQVKACQQTLEIVAQTRRLLQSASFPGVESQKVASSIQWLGGIAKDLSSRTEVLSRLLTPTNSAEKPSEGQPSPKPEQPPMPVSETPLNPPDSV